MTSITSVSVFEHSIWATTSKETSKLVLLLVKDVNIIVNPVSELGNIVKYVKEIKELLSQIVHAQMVSMMMVLMMLFVTFVLTDV
jgi:hypothetical protein